MRRDLRIPNETRCLAEVREAVHEVVLGSGFPREELNKLTLAVDEWVTNVMEHGYEHDLEGDLFIEIALEATPSEFVAVIRDWGRPFDPTSVSAPNLAEHIRKGRRHGLGIFLVRQIMDEATYSSCEGRNDLRLVKRAGAQRAALDHEASAARK